MGQACVRISGRQGGLLSNSSSIVPDQDPRCKVVVKGNRVVQADIARDFDLSQQVLGTGYSGAVKLAVHKTSKQKVAVKQFRKRGLKEHRLKLLKDEVEVYLSLDHPNICRLLHAYEKGDRVWLVMELCGCELYRRLCKQKFYGERDAVGVMTQMLQAVSYLHTHRVVHRDLKLENWMYGATDQEDRLKLIDFGFSRVLGDEEKELDMPCGTLHYTSPEVLQRKYTSQCDLWSLGVICYMLLLGRPPFRAPNNVKIAKAILSGEFPRDGRWSSLSEGARSFVEGLLQKDASRRMDAPTALQHRWLKEVNPRIGISLQGVEEASLTHLAAFEGEEVLRNLRKFARGSHLQRAALTVLAYSLTSREIQDFEQVFLDLDVTGRGTVTLDQLEKVMKEKYPDVASEEVRRIFECVDVSNDEEIYYSSFIAAMLATRVRQHEDKVRAAFEAFDTDGCGYITADSLKRVFAGSTSSSGSRTQSAETAETAADSVQKAMEAGGLSQDEAEAWIREVDYKGNGVIDYEGFVAALTGKHLWTTALLENEDSPAVKVFEDDTQMRSRGYSDTIHPSGRGMKVLGAIIDVDDEDNPRPHSFSPGMQNSSLQVRTRSCKVNESYF